MVENTRISRDVPPTPLLMGSTPLVKAIGIVAVAAWRQAPPVWQQGRCG